MMRVRFLLSAILALPLWAVANADSAEISPGVRLVPGGVTARSESPSLGLGESRLPLASTGKLTAGALSGPASGMALPFGLPGSSLAVGGYVAYGSGSTQVSSSLRSDGISRGANVSASWGGDILGLDSKASVSLGMSRSDLGRISPNSQHPSLSLADPYRDGSDISMSLSLIHQVSPSFSVGGMAGANRGSGSDSSGSGLMLGAGLGYRF